jgi:hypothetical protein
LDDEMFATEKAGHSTFLTENIICSRFFEPFDRQFK